MIPPTADRGARHSQFRSARSVRSGRWLASIAVVVAGISACTGAQSPAPSAQVLPSGIHSLGAFTFPPGFASGQPSESQPTVDATLEGQLPAAVGGLTIRRSSGSGAEFAGRASNCSVFCPDEVAAFADLAHALLADVRYAFGVSEGSTDAVVVIRALRIPGSQRLDKAWLDAVQRMRGTIERSAATIRGKDVTVAIAPLRSDVDATSYVWAAGDTVFIVSGLPAAPQADHPSDPISAAIAALP
jgi:hypothetical protein